MHLPRRILLPLLLSALAMVECSENPTEPNNDLPYTISGTLVDRTSEPVPGSTRVVVAWVVSSGSPDYTYVYGEGALQEQAGTFSLTFDAPPPAAALNSSGLGVGIVLLTTDAELQAGDDLGETTSGIVGAAGEYAVIYLDSDPEEIGGWPSDFRPGYSVGRDVDLPGTFDGFEPVRPSSIEIIVDDPENIDFVNWT